MPTIINSPGNMDDSATGVVVGVLVALLVIALFIIYYGLPAFKNTTENPNSDNVNLNVTLPVDNSAPSAPNNTSAY
ncbi:MAG: hypothetical protein AAB511_04440 [Patescibacteria group bacterium]